MWYLPTLQMHQIHLYHIKFRNASKTNFSLYMVTIRVTPLLYNVHFQLYNGSTVVKLSNNTQEQGMES